MSVSDASQTTVGGTGAPEPEGADERGDAAPRDAALDPDVVFSVLKNWRRRTVLRHLRADGDLTVGELAERIAAEENDVTPRQLSSQQRKRVYVSLYQCHLPKMDDAGVIDYNQSRGTVVPTDAIAQVTRYLDDDLAWWRYYLGVALAVGVLYAAATVALAAPGWLHPLTVAALVVGVAGVATVQRARSWRTGA